MLRCQIEERYVFQTRCCGCWRSRETLRRSLRVHWWMPFDWMSDVSFSVWLEFLLRWDGHFDMSLLSSEQRTVLLVEPSPHAGCSVEINRSLGQWILEQSGLIRWKQYLMTIRKLRKYYGSQIREPFRTNRTSRRPANLSARAELQDSSPCGISHCSLRRSRLLLSRLCLSRLRLSRLRLSRLRCSLALWIAPSV